MAGCTRCSCATVAPSDVQRLPLSSLYPAIALVSCAVLFYEVAVTRILSVVLWYHFAFLSVSLALLGLGAPGVWFTLRRPGRSALPAALLAAGLAIPGSVVVIFKLGSPLEEAGRYFTGFSSLLHGGLVLVVISLLAPLLCLGSALCLLLMQVRGRDNGLLYGADLLGAAVGAAVVVPLMHRVPTPLLVAGAGLLPLLAVSLLWARLRLAVACLALALLASMAWQEPFRLRYAKEYWEPENLLYEKWTPTARITVLQTHDLFGRPGAAYLWGRGRNYEDRYQEQLWLEQDGSAGTPITRLGRSLQSLSHLDFDVTGVGYQLRSPDRVCVIGAGGGRDILAALKAGAREVDAVELNPHVIEAVSGPFGEFSGDVYHLPGVNAFASEGRSFLSRSRKTYDLIQISLTDSWSATAAGAFALSENYLYTVEALRLYWHRLTPDGVVSISRYRIGDRQFESPRLALLALRSLTLEGVAEPSRHLAVVKADGIANLLMSRRAFDDDLLARIDAICLERGFDRLWPLVAGTAGPSSLTEVLSQGLQPYQSIGLDLSPPTDDRPFFFQMLSILGRVDRSRLTELSVNENAVTLLRGLLLLVTALCLFLFFLPFFLARGPGRRGAFWRGTGYFAAIGLGFILVEAPWIQRFILYLGHPSYATTIVLAALLLGAGLGSLSASAVPLEKLRGWGWLLPVVVVLVNLALAPLFEATLGQPFALRIALSLALIAPAGFLMGFCFPLGMVVFGDEDKAWFWAVNGATGVMATVLALVVSMASGLTLTGYLGAAAYAAAVALLGVPQVRQ